MPQFLFKPEDIENNIVKISGTDARHIHKVLRKEKGSPLVLTDGIGNIYQALIIDISSKEVIAELLGKTKSSDLRHELVLYQCLPRLDKMDLIVQKAVELGASQIVPLICQRSQAIAPERLKEKEKRWQRIANEAAKQCGQANMPIIEGARKLSGLQEVNGLAIALWEEEKSLSFREILTNSPRQRKISLLIGPEGGLTVNEIELLKSKGWQTAGLGARILRLETAAIVGLGIIQYEYGELSPEVENGAG